MFLTNTSVSQLQSQEIKPFALTPICFPQRLRSRSAAPVPAADPADQTRPGAVRADEGAIVSYHFRLPAVFISTLLANTNDLN